MKRYSVYGYKTLDRFCIYDSKTNLRTLRITINQLLYLTKDIKKFNAVFRIVFENNNDYIFIFDFEDYEDINDIIINNYPEMIL